MTTYVPADGSSAGVVDWEELRAEAGSIRSRAHAPYSRYLVGAAGLTDGGRVLTGCNVENSSIGVTLCAECGVVSNLHATGGGHLVAIACVGGRFEGEPGVVLPCGRCRQLLAENGGPTLRVDAPAGPRLLADLLPDAFGPDDLRR